jgi:hypothetical protein
LPGALRREVHHIFPEDPVAAPFFQIVRQIVLLDCRLCMTVQQGIKYTSNSRLHYVTSL